MSLQPEQPPRRSLTMGRLTAIVLGAIALIAVVVLALVFTLGGNSHPSSTPAVRTGEPQTNPSGIASSQPLDTTKPKSTLAPKPNPSFGSVGQKFNAGQLIAAETAVSQGYLQYCAYQPKESAFQHLGRMQPYFSSHSKLMNPNVLASDVSSATCNTLENQIAGVDSKGQLVISLVVKSKAQLKGGGTRNRTISAYVTVVEQNKSWRVLDIQQSSVASK